MNLVDIQESHRFPTDKGDVHSYLDVYDLYFSRFRDLDIHLFEIGVRDDGSLQLWRKYFSRAIIEGIDINSTEEVPGTTIYLGNFLKFEPKHRYDGL